MTEILTVTLNPALDLSSETDRVLPDRKLRCAVPRVQAGGGGVNVSRAIAILGGTSRALVGVGGNTGTQLIQLLTEQPGLTALALELPHETRSSLSVIDRGAGQQFRFVMPGPTWSPQDAATADSRIVELAAQTDLLVVSGSVPPGLADNFFCRLADRLPQRTRMILDTSGAALSAVAGAGQGLYALRMDHDEAQMLSGHPCAELTEIAALARNLHRRGVAEQVLIAAGAQGTVLANDQGCWLTRPPVVRVHSKTGAGDSFVAGFTQALAQGHGPLEACRFGTAAAASAVTTPDTDLCSAAETQRYANEVTISDFC